MLWAGLGACGFSDGSGASEGTSETSGMGAANGAPEIGLVWSGGRNAARRGPVLDGVTRDAFKVPMGPASPSARPRVSPRLRQVGKSELGQASHPCATLCLSCGYLREPAVEAGYRRLEDGLTSGACSACGEDGWLDLRGDYSMQVLADDDASSRASRGDALSRWRGWATRSAGVLLVGGGGMTALIVIFLGFLQRYPYSAWVVLGPFVLAAMSIFVVRLRGLGLPPRVRALPLRWRLALPSPSSPSVPKPTQALPSDELLTAPLSGRPCVAYEIGLREDDASQADIGTWLLLEQGVAPLRIAGVDVPRDSARLRLEQRTAFEARTAEDRARRERFLRERGFTGQILCLFETVIPADTELSARTENGLLVVEPAG